MSIDSVLAKAAVLELALKRVTAGWNPAEENDIRHLLEEWPQFVPLLAPVCVYLGYDILSQDSVFSRDEPMREWKWNAFHLQLFEHHEGDSSCHWGVAARLFDHGVPIFHFWHAYVPRAGGHCIDSDDTVVAILRHMSSGPKESQMAEYDRRQWDWVEGNGDFAGRREALEQHAHELTELLENAGSLPTCDNKDEYGEHDLLTCPACYKRYGERLHEQRENGARTPWQSAWGGVEGTAGG